ncbi:MAG: hypothetical protein AB1801_10940 [Chloroflexota bacterium]
MDFEEKYQDVLQNIEFGIIKVYHRHADLLDYDVETALAALIRAYQAEQSPRPVNPPALNELRQELYDAVKSMCEWRLGRAELTRAGRSERLPTPRAITVDEIIACLKRIRKSVQKWNKHGGRQGYLTFVEQFIR